MKGNLRNGYALGLARKMTLAKYLTLCFGLVWLCCFPLSTEAQFSYNVFYTPTKLVEDVLLGNRIKVNNVRIRGKKGTFGYFKDESEHPLIGEGVIFSTGYILDAQGPNQRPSTGKNVGGPKDRELFYLADGPTYDATGIDFDFIPEYETVTFNFIFGSEEYTEYVNSQFNDVFAFFISGPGYNGRKNLAVIPGTNVPITINTINHAKNKAFYIDNNWFNRVGKPDKSRIANLDSVWFNTFEMDGLTKPLKITARVKPGEIYHIKISLCDVSDGAFDSMVILEGRSFTSLPRDPVKAQELLARDTFQFRRTFEPGVLGKREPIQVAEVEEEQPKEEGGEKEGIEVVEEIPEEKKEDVGEKPEKPEKPVPLTSVPVSDQNWRLMVNFDLDAAILNAEAEQQIQEVLLDLLAHPERKLLVQGHTCDLGNRNYNQRLSEARARAVRDYLIRAGIREEAILLSGYNYSQPEKINSSEVNRASNRRVEVRWR